MDPREYDWQIGDLAAQDLYPNEVGLQPPQPTPPPGQRQLGRGLAPMLGVPSWLEQAVEQNKRDRAAIAAGATPVELLADTHVTQDLAGGFGGNIKKPPPPGAILGQFPTTTPRRIIKETLGENKGYSVHVPTGEIPKEGLMVGTYKNADPRTTVIAPELLKPSVVKEMAERNAKALAKVDRHLGTWVGSDGNVYLDVAQRFPAPNIRKATKFGERTGQLKGWDIGKAEEFPIGNWREFVAGPEQFERWRQMYREGSEYMAQRPTQRWWSMQGTPFERVYGEENLPQVAGFSAATAPISNPMDNMRIMSEYMRRKIAGEPVIQPDWRMGPGGAWLSEGKKLPLEQSRIANLEKAAAGNLGAMRKRKVGGEANVMSGFLDDAVIDRWQVRGTEDPSRGIFAGPTEGAIRGDVPKRGIGDYDWVVNNMRTAAQAHDVDLAKFSSNVWAGIRNRVKNFGELFGTKFRKSAVQGESQSYADTFQDLLQQKARENGMSVEKFDHLLRTGKANLLSQLIASSPVLMAAYKSYMDDQQPGALARQDQYD